MSSERPRYRSSPPRTGRGNRLKARAPKSSKIPHSAAAVTPDIRLFAPALKLRMVRLRAVQPVSAPSGAAMMFARPVVVSSVSSSTSRLVVSSMLAALRRMTIAVTVISAAIVAILPVRAAVSNPENEREPKERKKRSDGNEDNNHPSCIALTRGIFMAASAA